MPPQVTGERRAMCAPPCAVTAAGQGLGSGAYALQPHMMHLLGIRHHPHAHIFRVAARIVARALRPLQPDQRSRTYRESFGERVAAVLDRGSAAVAAEIVKGGEWAASALEGFGRNVITTRVPPLLARTSVHPRVVSQVKKVEKLSVEVSERVSKATEKIYEHRDRVLACVARRMTDPRRQSRPEKLVAAAVVVGAACVAVSRVWGACDDATASISASACVVGIELIRHSAGEEAGGIAKDIVAACERVRDARWAVEEIVEIDLVSPHLFARTLGQSFAKSTALQVMEGVNKWSDGVSVTPVSLSRSSSLQSFDLSSISTSPRESPQDSDWSELMWQPCIPLDAEVDEERLQRTSSSQSLDDSWTEGGDGIEQSVDDVLCLALPFLTNCPPSSLSSSSSSSHPSSVWA